LTKEIASNYKASAQARKLLPESKDSGNGWKIFASYSSGKGLIS
jgi:hypothetical protein